MKKIVLIFISLLITTQVYTASFTVFGKVYNEDGAKGTSLTANSYCGLKTYRKLIPGEIGIQNIGPDSNCHQKIFPSYYLGVDTPAYFNSDVGSYNWTTVVGVGQYVITVVEVYEDQFPLCIWDGISYIGARIKVLSQQEIEDCGVDMPDTRLEPIPVPQPQTILSDSVTLTWTGLSYDPDNLITGYTVYRSTEPGGIGGYQQLTITASQIKGGIIYYTDSGLNQTDTYYYKIAVNFEWGGGNGAPDYFISNAMSAASTGIYLGPTPTITLTLTDTPFYTQTYTHTETWTYTFTPTMTDTATETDTSTYTITETDTQTLTITYTQTISYTFTPTATDTVTETETSTYTNTYTDTPTYTGTPTNTYTDTPTYTGTPTNTYTDTSTYTGTPTNTYTDTPTNTPTYTITETETQTLTITYTQTPSYTFTPSQTLTLTETHTPTLTITYTTTLTLTPTITPTLQPQISDSLKYRLLRNRIVVLNNPIKDGMLRIALYNENNGIVKISLYNINGELVMKINSNIAGGFAMLEEKISKASGIYILRTVIKIDTDTIELPLKKIGVVR